MIEQLANSVKFMAFFVMDKEGTTGLSVTVDVYNPSGSQVVTAAAAAEIGGGLYSYTLSSENTSSEGEYIAIFKTADDDVDQKHIPALWILGRAGIEHLDMDLSTIYDGGGNNIVTITIDDGANPLSDARVEIRDNGNNFKTLGVTNGDGEISFSLDDGDYYVYIRKDGYTFTIPETMTVDEDPETPTFSGTIIDVGAPSAANACRVYEWCFNIDDTTPLSEVDSTAKITELPADFNDKLYTGVITESTYNSTTGLLYWDIVIGSTVQFKIPDLGIFITKTIPDQESIRLLDIE